MNMAPESAGPVHEMIQLLHYLHAPPSMPWQCAHSRMEDGSLDVRLAGLPFWVRLAP